MAARSTALEIAFTDARPHPSDQVREIPLNSRLPIHVPRDFQNSNPAMQLLILKVRNVGVTLRAAAAQVVETIHG